MAEKRVHDKWKVSFDDGAKKGFEFLDYYLSKDQCRAYFEAADKHGKYDFEDTDRRDFRLTKETGKYSLERR